MRLRQSGQLKVLLLFGVGSVIFFGLHVLFPQTFRFLDGVTWRLIWQVSLAYLASLLAIFFVLPWISFHLTRFWRLALVFQFNQKEMRLSVSGKRGGLRLGWDQVRRVAENNLVFVVYYDDGQKHFILPKAGFSEANEERFRRLLEHQLGAGAAPPAENEEIEEADALEEDEGAEE